MRMIEMNKVLVTGRVTHEVELKYSSGNNAYLKFTIASNKSYKDKVTGEWRQVSSFIPVSVFGKTAEYISKVLKKGYAVYIEGNLKSSEFMDKTGNKRKALEVIADRINCLTKQNEPDNNMNDEYVPS